MQVKPKRDEKPKKRKKFWSDFIIILFILSLVLVWIDFLLTSQALTMGFYETNKFTNATSPLFHACTLTGMLTLLLCASRKWFDDNAGVAAFYTLFSLVWVTNNIYSVVLLY